MAAHPRPAAWSFQQAGEKSLKAVLLQLWRVFRTIYLIRAILAKTVRRVCRKEAQKAQESDGMRRRTAAEDRGLRRRWTFVGTCLPR